MFIGLSCSIPTIVLYFFSFLFFLSIGWYCGAWVFFGLIGCIPLSLSLALPTFFNNNNNSLNRVQLHSTLSKAQDTK